MSYLHKQSDTTKAIYFDMISSTDKTTGITGLSPTVTLSKNGGSFASCTGTVSEIGLGTYKLVPSAADVGTLGAMRLRATGTGADQYEREIIVVSFDPYNASNLGLGDITTNATPGQPYGLRINDQNYSALTNVIAVMTSITGGTTTRIKFNSAPNIFTGLVQSLVWVGSSITGTDGFRTVVAASSGTPGYVDVYPPLSGSAGAGIICTFYAPGANLPVAVNSSYQAINTTSGTGAYTVIVPVVRSDTLVALQNAIVRLTEGANTYTATSDVSGNATFNIDAATYTMAITKAGFSFGGDTLVVAGSATATARQMTPSTIPIPDDPSKTTLYFTSYNNDYDGEAGHNYEAVLTTAAPTTGGFPRETLTATSGVAGATSFAMLRSSKYKVRRLRADGTPGPWISITTDDAETTQAPSILGAPQE